MQNIVVSYTVRTHVKSLNLRHRPLKVGGVVDPKKHTPAPHTKLGRSRSNCMAVWALAGGLKNLGDAGDRDAADP